MPQAPVKVQRRPSAGITSQPSRGSMGWDDAVEAFLRDKRGQNLAPSSLENYRGHLLGARSKAFRADHGIKGPADLTAQALSEFQAELLDAGVSPALAHAYHRVLKNFARFCIERGLLEDESVLRVRAPFMPRKEPEIFTAAEEATLMSAAATPRDKFLMEFLMSTGLRLQELVNVRLDDIVDGTQGSYLRVRQGKGRKDRVVPLDSPRNQMSKSLNKYLTKVRPASSSPHLFLANRKGGRGEYEALTARGVQLLFRRLGQKTGIHVHPHKFRHTFATRALAGGVDVMALQRVLGHTTLAMVSRYVHYQADDLIKAWQRRSD